MITNGPFRVTDAGIEKVIGRPLPDFEDDASTTVILPKEIFIEAYNKWIKQSESNQ